MDTNFVRLAVIDDYNSFIWTTRYYTTGDFELCVDVSAKYMQLFQQGYYICRDDDEHIGIIEDIKIQRNEDLHEILIISGRFLSSLLGRRIISKQTTIDSTVSYGIYSLIVNEITSPDISERRIPNFVFGNYATLQRMQAQYTGKNLLETISTICKTYGIGFKVTLTEDNDFNFQLFEGVDRSYDQIENPYVVFSDEYDNLLSSEYEENYENLITDVLVAGEGEGLDRKTLWVSGGYKPKGNNILNPSNVINADLSNYSYENGVWSGTHTARTHGLAIVSANVFTVGKTYMLKYKFQRTAGTLEKIGGHCAGFTQIECYVDGNQANYDLGYSLSDDNRIHEVIFVGTYNGDNNNNNLYIQPNRLESTNITFKAWDIEVYEAVANTGIDRYEAYKDQRQLQSNDGEISEAEYNKLMREAGLEDLTTITQAFTGTVYFDNVVYKQDVNIGDICVIENSRWGLYINTRLVEVIESVSESGAYSIVPTFGI